LLEEIGIRDSWAAGSSYAYSATVGANLTTPAEVFDRQAGLGLSEKPDDLVSR
jgi:hypothetical protein